MVRAALPRGPRRGAMASADRILLMSQLRSDQGSDRRTRRCWVLQALFTCLKIDISDRGSRGKRINQTVKRFSVSTTTNRSKRRIGRQVRVYDLDDLRTANIRGKIKPLEADAHLILLTLKQ
jgi:hypothetical protein